jgi:hypothetical protein
MPPDRARGPWEEQIPTAVRQTGQFQDPAIRESSGVAVSRVHPGIIWTHNDAGHAAVLYATDTAGAALGRWRVTGAASIDWEDIALGPCPAGRCLYIGDVGDNREQRQSVTLYRLPEPVPSSAGGDTAPAESLVVRYPDRPRDVEALYVDEAGDTWLVSKGRQDGVFLYRVPATRWGQGSVVAELVDTLPIPHDRTSWQLVTGAAIAPDQRTVVIRTYLHLFQFSRDSTGRLTPSARPGRCLIQGLEPQGEAVDWWDDSTLVLTSEGGGGVRGPIHLVRCE